MGQTFCFIDGFNLYHALAEERAYGYKKYNQYKWINYWKPAQEFCGRSNQLARVIYFTSVIPKGWGRGGAEKRDRHECFIRAQMEYGVEVVHGRFRPVEKMCLAKCRLPFKTYEEKRTDVNIASAIISYGVGKAYDNAVIISGDSDLIPAIETAKHLNPGLYFRVVVPIGKRGHALANAADSTWRMREAHLKRSLMPDQIPLKSGEVLHRPQRWHKIAPPTS